jgi:integrase
MGERAVAQPQRRPANRLLATLTLVGLRISELCALDGEDLDFAGRRIYVPRLRKDRDGQLVRVQGINVRRTIVDAPVERANALLGPRSA